MCVCVSVCVRVYLHTHSSWFDLNPPQPEIAAVRASLAWGGVSPLRNMIHRINIPDARQLCCKLLAHAFACVLIIQSCVAKWEIFFFLLTLVPLSRIPYRVPIWHNGVWAYSPRGLPFRRVSFLYRG